MDFSVIITTRKRVTYLRQLVLSLHETIGEKSNVEIHINYDNDDADTHRTLDMLDQYPDLLLQFHRRERSIWMHTDYINWCVFNFCKGKYLISVNDDCAFRTPNWDRHVFARAEYYLRNWPDGVMCGRTQDCHPDKPHCEEYEYSSFPMISRAAVDALGFMFNNEFNSWNADVAIGAIFKNIGRNIDMRDICIIDHITDYNGRRPRDEIDDNTERLYREGTSPPWETNVPRDTEILRAYIENYNRKRPL